MRVLLDENISPRVASSFPEHSVVGVVAAGFGSLKNGNLLDAAEAAGFDVLLTVDKNLHYQQSFTHRAIAVVVLDIHPIGLRAVRDIASAILDALVSILPGQVIVIEGPHPKRNK